MSAVYILWLRQLKRFFRRRARIIGSIGQPLLYLVALGFGLNPVFRDAGRGDYLQFLTPGIIAMTIIFTAIFSGIEIIWDRQFGFLKETLVSPVPRYQIMIGRSLGGASIATLQGIIVLVLATVIGFRPLSFSGVMLALLVMFLTALAFTSLGTAIASQLEDMQGFQLIMNFLVMPLFFLSGAIFPLTGLPAFMAILVRIDPLTYGVDGLRAALIGQNQFPLVTDIGVLMVLTSFLLLVGTYLFSKIEV
ncbi:MAG: ABC transporter permease [Patescibacteria group bacterium]|jgi:ABC-2 type transport system permease protein